MQLIFLYKILIEKKEFVLTRQLLRRGTSIGTNVEEATVAPLKRDFIAKMAIASKEARGNKVLAQTIRENQISRFDNSGYLIRTEHLINILNKNCKNQPGIIALIIQHLTFKI